MGHLTRKLSKTFEISRWWPFFKTADNLSGAVTCYNGLFGDTSMQFLWVT